MDIVSTFIRNFARKVTQSLRHAQRLHTTDIYIPLIRFTIMMRILGNILWLILGGLETAIGYLFGSLALAITIIGLPLAWQTLKLGLLCLWPFGARVRDTSSPLSGCLYLMLNIIWLLTGGVWIALTHILFGILLCITLIGIPWGKQHFKMAGFALTPFGKEIEW